jgi:hypothetical protein
VKTVVRYFRKRTCLLLFLLFAFASYATSQNASLFKNKNHTDDLSSLFPSKTVYFGVNIGGGSTEWKYLVDTSDPGDPADATTPVAVNEGGPSWGIVFGYDVVKNFAIELQYMEFANSNISFDENGYDTYGYYNVVSKTDAYSLSGKFFVPVSHTHLRAFAAIGAGLVERRDPLVSPNPDLPPSGTTASCVSPYMSGGLDYNFTRHWITEVGFQYYTGFGASEINPVDSFIPFAWDAYGRLAYQL